MTSSLLLVGCGKMGGALLARWQETHPAGIRRFRVIEPAQPRPDSEHVHWFENLEALPAAFTPDVIVFAVKPQLLPSLLPAYRERFKDAMPLYVSIAAGRTLRFFTAQLGERARVVRAMPNTAASVGEAMTVLCAAQTVPPTARNIATELMEAVGEVLWVEDESEMDAVTALSGSGPAYVFLFMESLTNAAVAAGLTPEVARALAVKTVRGSAALVGQSKETFETLRKSVTSPGGTTEAALSILMKDNQLEKLLTEAVLKAVKRSHELAE